MELAALLQNERLGALDLGRLLRLFLQIGALHEVLTGVMDEQDLRHAVHLIEAELIQRQEGVPDLTALPTLVRSRAASARNTWGSVVSGAGLSVLPDAAQVKAQTVDQNARHIRFIALLQLFLLLGRHDRDAADHFRQPADRRQSL